MEILITDAVVGGLTLTLDRDGGTVRVEGDAIPTVVVRRSVEAAPLQHIPIGTRGTEDLTMTLDGAPVALRPAPGRVTRDSYRAEVDHEGITYSVFDFLWLSEDFRHSGPVWSYSRGVRSPR
ncbi:hypothetical protein [Streptosporangium lutulentum]|uniref:Uncharacterized protein n=1 Tax=Streptosporangium lutulentum TaxID=1461250 RepID=A0ABT9Q839_9ACTN|nr:hypothetical protein [Streptosporangium lutulentum]MDP9842478.1 hypothetical protein [Streptosporangium lutulentum]